MRNNGIFIFILFFLVLFLLKLLLKSSELLSELNAFGLASLQLLAQEFDVLGVVSLDNAFVILSRHSAYDVVKRVLVGQVVLWTAVWHATRLFELLDNGRENLIVDVARWLQALGRVQLAVEASTDSYRTDILLLLLHAEAFERLGELELEVGLRLADHLDLEAQLFVLARQVLNIVLHLFVFELRDTARVHLATLTELFQLSLKLDTVLSEVCDKSLELFNLGVLVHIVHGSANDILNELFVAVLLDVRLEVLDRGFRQVLSVHEIEF